jgi:hypothetical protein
MPLVSHHCMMESPFPLTAEVSGRLLVKCRIGAEKAVDDRIAGHWPFFKAKLFVRLHQKLLTQVGMTGRPLKTPWPPTT